jgi:hypothetical protein
LKLSRLLYEAGLKFSLGFSYYGFNGFIILANFYLGSV